MKSGQQIVFNDKKYLMSEVMKLLHLEESSTSIDCKANFVAALWNGKIMVKTIESLRAFYKKYPSKTAVKGSYNLIRDIEKVKQQSDLKVTSYAIDIQDSLLIQTALKNKGFHLKIYSIKK